MGVALWLAFACAGLDSVLQARELQAGGIAGSVVATEDGRPVPGALVTIEGSNLVAVTDVVGRFEIENVPAGPTTLIVRASGFVDLLVPSVPVTVGMTASLTIELEVTPNFLERVQVTASRAPLSIGEVAAQADIVDRSTFEARGDQSLTAAISHVPGVVVSTQAGSFESVMLRGLPRDGNEFTSTLLLIDGVPQTDSRNSSRVINLPITDASSIEVIRGPNSALYGRTAIGGSINVRTADPTPEHQTGFDITGGGFGMLKGVAKASGPLDDWGGYYVSASSERNSGFYKGPFDFTVDETALFAKMTFVPDAKSFGSVSVNRVISDQSLPTNEPIVDGQFLSDLSPEFDRLSDLNVPGPNYHQSEGRVTANYTRQFSDALRMVNVFGHRQIQYKFIDSGDITGAPFDLASNTMTMYPFEMQTDEDIFYEELRFEFEPNLGLLRDLEPLVIAGGSYEHTTGFGAGNLMYTDPSTFGWPLNYLNPVHPAKSDWEFFRFGGNDYSVGIMGLFGQLSIEPTNRLLLTAGGRYDRLALDNRLTFRDGQPVVKDTFDAFSPKVSAVFQLLPDDADAVVNAYAQYSQAFLPPRRPSGLRPGDDEIKLNPEDIDNYEVGLKGGLLDGDVSFELAYFRMTRDGIVHSVRQGPFFVPTNAGEHKYRGIETGINWSATPQVSIYANGAFYHNRFGTFLIESSRGNTVLTGNRLPIAPDRIINAGAVITPAPDINIRLDVKYVGDVMLDQGNTFELSPYTLFDAAVSWHLGPTTRVTLSAHNLLNEEYYWNGDTSRAESADPGAPRQILLTTSFNFR